MSFIDKGLPMKITEQCSLLDVPRSSFYHRPVHDPRREDEILMKAIDRIAMEEPTFGVERMKDALTAQNHQIGHDRTRRLMRQMGITPIYPKPRLSIPDKDHKVYPYLLRDIEIERSNQVWCADITYVPLEGSHVYLFAVMDWYSRRILSWRLSNSLDVAPCLEALDEALEREDAPEIFNTDQGCQFTSAEWTSRLREHGIQISMDGRGRALDNRMIERFWRSVKYDDLYIRGYETMAEVRAGLERYIEKYNARRHQTLGESPNARYAAGQNLPAAA